MKRIAAMLGLGLFLAGCGADGEPVRPSMNANVGIDERGMSVNTGAGFVHGRMSMHVGTAL